MLDSAPVIIGLLLFMGTRDTVRKAWQITQVHLKKLIWYGALPSFFVIVVSSGYLAYQYNSLRHSSLFSQEPGPNMIDNFKVLWGYASSYPGLALGLALTAAFFLFGYTIFPPVFHGALIHALNRIRLYEPIKGSMQAGMRHFFPLFEFSLLSGVFGVTTLFTQSSFILLWWGEKIYFVALPILLFIAIVGFVISFLFTYAEYYIVLHDKKLIRAAMDSSVLVVSNLRKTFLVFVLMMLIGARIVLNVILVLLIPMVVVAAATYFATLFFSAFGFIFIGSFALIVLGVSAYLFGLFHIFATAVWTLTFGMLYEDQ